MRGKDAKLCQRELNPHLEDLRSAIERASGIEVIKHGTTEAVPLDKDTLGIKVWIVPAWYYALSSYDRRATRAWADFSSTLVRWPRLRLVGELKGSEQGSSGTRWTIGKGFVGQSTFALTEPEQFCALVHHRDWTDGIEKLPRREFLALDPEVRRGRTRSDFRNLRAVYGTAVGTALRPSTGRRSFGCVTAHTPNTAPLASDAAIEACGELLCLAAQGISNHILEKANYRVPGVH